MIPLFFTLLHFVQAHPVLCAIAATVAYFALSGGIIIALCRAAVEPIGPGGAE